MHCIILFYNYPRGLAIIAVCVMIVIVALLWFCLFAAPAIGTPFEGISLGGYWS